MHNKTLTIVSQQRFETDTFSTMATTWAQVQITLAGKQRILLFEALTTGHKHWKACRNSSILWAAYPKASS